jgi:hypothetical protein
MAMMWRCLNCERGHSTFRLFNYLKGEFFSVGFCSDRCLQKYHKKLDIGLLETHPKKEGYPIYRNIGNKEIKVGHMDKIVMWIHPEMKITLIISKNTSFWSRLTKYESYTKINGSVVPIYRYIVKE